MTPLLQDLLAGSVDVVVGRIGGRALQLPLNYKVLYTEPVCFVARAEHPLAKYATLSWNDLANWRWIVWPTGTPIRISIDNALVDHGVMLPENTIESASMNVSTNLLQSSDMISILSLRHGATLCQPGTTGDPQPAKDRTERQRRCVLAQ